jgi:hypothetical protein
MQRQRMGMGLAEMGLKLKQRPAQTLDIIDLSTGSLSAENFAQKLVAKHQGDLKVIENKIFSTEFKYSLKIPGFNFRKEVWWAAQWLAQKK